jgi:hypothetical protein
MRSKEMRFKCVLDPLFDRKIFSAICLAGSLSLAMYLIFGRAGFPPDRAPESAETEPDTSELADKEDSQYELETPYEHGFRVGYNALLKQTGQYIPQAGDSSKRTASYSMDDEEVSRGYVDGYHRASDFGMCPRGL